MGGLAAYVAQRFVLVALAAVIVSGVLFIGVHQLPGDAFLSEKCHARCDAAELHRYNLDRPWPIQYRDWLIALAHGDLGESLVNQGQRITPLLMSELSVSATLGIVAVLIAVILGLTAGALSAYYHNQTPDRLLSGGVMLGYSIPNFAVAFVLIWWTVSGFYTWSHGTFYENIGWGRPEQVPVPALALALHPAATIARLTRVSLLDVMSLDYVQMARAKGLSERRVVIRHALRNALIPVVTHLGPMTTAILTGSVVIENVFGIPGLGKEFATSIQNRDYNIVIGVFTFYSALIGLAHIAVDLIYPVLDPRIRAW